VQIQCATSLPAHIDAVLIPGSYAHQATELAATMNFFHQHRDWFIELERQGCLLAAACNGSFALAATGLLDQQQATTCWFLAEFFQQQFPAVRLDAAAVVKRAGHCLTAGATTAYLSLCLAVIQQFDGTRFASQLAKILLIEPAIHGQAPFLSVDQLVHHTDERIADVQAYLRNHLAEPVDLQQLAARFAMSSRTLIRRFKAATGETPMAWLQKLRVDKAKMLLESSNLSVEQLTRAIGYEDVSSFRKLFQQYTRMTPKAYRSQFTLQTD
jgi:transcriptional regulator GlxA family with amidase domain